MSDPATSIWGVIPAAGIGRRMQSAIPKQYLSLHGKTILQHSCERLLDTRRVHGLVVAVREDDRHWDAVQQALQSRYRKPVIRVIGGAERADSVCNALLALQAHVGNSDNCLVLVHDAVRPCVRSADIETLIETAMRAGDDGALLAMPVRDTMKRSAGDGRIRATVPREHLWHALTPQCFPLSALLQALQQALQNSLVVTDEASAMEQAGLSPHLVHGADDNIKITRPDDLPLAEWSLRT